MTTELAVWNDDPHAEEGRKTSSRPVDLVHLSRYTLGERALEREVLELFCSQSFVYLERLRTAGSHKDWKDAAHSLKGSATAIGAQRRGAFGRGAVPGEGASAARDRILIARGGELYRHAARGSLSGETP